MARFRAMSPGKSLDKTPAAPAAKAVPPRIRRDVLPPIHPDIDMARYELLGEVKIRGGQRILRRGGFAHCPASALPVAGIGPKTGRGRCSAYRAFRCQ